MPIRSACILELMPEEAFVVRDAMADYVKKDGLKIEENDAAWRVLAELTSKLPKRTEEENGSTNG